MTTTAIVAMPGAIARSPTTGRTANFQSGRQSSQLSRDDEGTHSRPQSSSADNDRAQSSADLDMPDVDNGRQAE